VVSESEIDGTPARTDYDLEMKVEKVLPEDAGYEVGIGISNLSTVVGRDRVQKRGRIGFAKIVLPKTGLPKGLTIGGGMVDYSLPLFPFFLPDTGTPSYKVEGVGLPNGLRLIGDGTSTAGKGQTVFKTSLQILPSQERSDSRAEGQGTLSLEAAFDARGALRTGTTTLVRADGTVHLSVQRR
jgi:hypothetical protein